MLHTEGCARSLFTHVIRPLRITQRKSHGINPELFCFTVAPRGVGHKSIRDVWLATPPRGLTATLRLSTSPRTPSSWHALRLQLRCSPKGSSASLSVDSFVALGSAECSLAHIHRHSLISPALDARSCPFDSPWYKLVQKRTNPHLRVKVCSLLVAPRGVEPLFSG